jgi:hypothetical protein
MNESNRWEMTPSIQKGNVILAVTAKSGLRSLATRCIAFEMITHQAFQCCYLLVKLFECLISSFDEAFSVVLFQLVWIGTHHRFDSLYTYNVNEVVSRVGNRLWYR